MTRVLLAKPGLDGHDKGIKVLAMILRDGGHEVINTGLHQTPVRIVSAALQEDVQVVGLSMLSGAHLPLTRDVLRLLSDAGAVDIQVVVGGNIPRQDIAALIEMGVVAVFPGGTSYDDILEWFARLPERSH